MSVSLSICMGAPNRNSTLALWGTGAFIWGGAYFFKNVRWEQSHWWWAHVPGSSSLWNTIGHFKPSSTDVQRTRKSHFNGYASLQQISFSPKKRIGSPGDHRVGWIECFFYSLTQTSLNANSLGMQTYNVGPHKGVAEFSKTFRTISFKQAQLALPNPESTEHSCSPASNASSPVSLPPPRPFSQPHVPRSSWSTTGWRCLPWAESL